MLQSFYSSLDVYVNCKLLIVKNVIIFGRETLEKESIQD